ncbi:MAG TPA: hypothetical protein VGN57_19820 [Pirellulaceae bacterium]|jgi:hypothetical protein|nr:hypothetical protein [Pirellulaceae bacterium]
MSRSIAFHVLWASLSAASLAFGPSLAFGDDDLFSDLQVESVYNSSGSAADLEPSSTAPTLPAGGPDSPVEIAGPASLAEALRNGGFDPQEANSQYLTVMVRSGETQKNAFATVSEDRKRVQLVLPLDALAKGAKLPADQLTALMEANRADRAERFAFSAKLGRVELHRSIDNEGVTGARLREALEAMTAVAEETKSLWNLADVPASTPAASSTAATNAASAANSGTSAAATSLVGSWTASRSKTQAFALRLDADGKFALVTVDGTRNVQSSGSYVLGSGKLSLNDAKGGSLAGTIAVRSAEEFEFTPAGGSAAALVFKKAK